MSVNLETSTEVQEQTLQPVDSVVTETEEIATPQSDDGKIVIEIDEQESGQETSAQSVDNDSAIYKRAKAAEAKAKKAKEKAKLEHEARIASEQRENELLERIKQLESSVNPIVNPRPKRDDYYSDDEYDAAVDAYYQNKGNAQAKPQVETQQQEQFNEQAFEADYYLRESESNVAKSYPKYSEDKEQLLQKFSTIGGNEQTFTYFSAIALQAKIDIAKAYIALNRNSDLFRALINAENSGNQFAIADVLKQAANKVDLRTVKKVDTLPTPDIKNSGPIDNHAAEIEKARNKWVESRTSKDYAAYRALKKKVTNNG